MQRRRAGPEAGPEDDRGVEFGWKAHAAIQDWTRTVDQKASITLVFTTALGTLAAREVLSPEGGLHNPVGAQLWAVRGMGLLFATAALLALGVVFPQLRRRKAKAEAHAGLVYFGHLRFRCPADVEAALARLDPGEARHQLARQLVHTGRIAWRKHAFLRWSLCALVGAITFFWVARLLL